MAKHWAVNSQDNFFGTVVGGFFFFFFFKFIFLRSVFLAYFFCTSFLFVLFSFTCTYIFLFPDDVYERETSHSVASAINLDRRSDDPEGIS